MSDLNSQLLDAYRKLKAACVKLELARMLPGNPGLLQAKYERMQAESMYGDLYHEWCKANPGQYVPEFL